MRLFVLLALLTPLTTHAAATPEALVAAMDVDPTTLVPNSISTLNPLYGASNPQMFDVVGNLGVIPPYGPPDMALLSTGNADGLCNDYDYPPGGEGGDSATLSFQLNVPDDANSYGFNFFFLSREYPEYVGQIYNDEFSVEVTNPAWSGQIVFDAFGNVVSVNNALFVVTTPGPLTGTCFDEHGGTGWTQTVAPVTPGSVLELTFNILDRGDGIFDSAVLIDNFLFSSIPIDEPGTEIPNPDGPLRLSFLSPKEGDIAGDYEVAVTGRGFNADTVLLVDGEPVPEGDISIAASGELILIASMPAHAEGDVDIEVQRGDETVTLETGFAYWAVSPGERPPRIRGVFPHTLSPDGGTELQVRGDDFDREASVVFLTVGEGGEFTGSTDAASIEPRELEDGTVELIVVAPPHATGWVDLLVTNPTGAESVPGYPVDYDGRATQPREPGQDCSCSSGGGQARWGLLLGLLLLRRRRHNSASSHGPL
jgi:MYXO-CTERM domain-containing protein